MFFKSEEFYDAIYSFKDYPAEVAKLDSLIRTHKKSGGRELLDVACGTAMHISLMSDRYAIQGLDADEKMVEIARKKCPDIPFHRADMTGFDLRKQFDVVTCLFSSIAYTKTPALLSKTIANLARHLKPGGVLVIEPFVSPEQWREGGVHAVFVDKPDLKIARMNIHKRDGNVAAFLFHYVVGTPGAVEYFTESHELGLFTKAEYLAAFDCSGLEVTYDEKGLMDRGLYIAVKPLV